MPQTGLTQLGNALLQGSGDYANIQLRRQAEDRQRAQQLADLQDQRRFVTENRDYERNLSLMDEARRRERAVDDATLQILLKDGWLKPTDARNELAIQEAADRRQKALGATQAREAALPAKLQQEADYLGSQDIELSQAESQLNAMLSAPQPGAPSPAEVRRVAIQMSGKPVPSDKEIADLAPAATSAIMNDRMNRWLTDKEDAKIQVQLLRSQRTALRQSLTGLLQQGFVPNRPPPAPVATLAAPVSGLRPATAEQAAAAAGGRPVGVPAGTPAPVAPSTEYGGVMGLAPSMGTLGAAISDPMGALEVGGRQAMSGPARLLNLFVGGERRAAEGDAERAAGMTDALSRFNQPSQAIPVNPFWGGNYMPPLKPLPSTRSLQYGPAY